MKITFLLPGVKISGGIRSTFEIANCLTKMGNDVSVVYPLVESLNGRKWHNVKGTVGRIIRGYRNFRQGPDIGWFDLQADLIRAPFISERWIPKGDVIVATWWANAYDVHRYRSDKGAKVYFIRGYETWGGPEELVKKSYTLPLHKIVTSSWLKNIIERLFNVQTSGPIPNGLNSNLFYREEIDFQCHNPKRIGILYRKGENKGMREGLETFSIVKKKHHNVQLVLFGEEPIIDDLKIIHKVGNIEFHKLPYKERLRKIYNSLDIFIFPSLSEGFGNPPMEAMACGAACVTTNVGGIPDYTIPGKTALVVLPKNPDMMALKVIELLEAEEQRKKIAEAGNRYIKQFTWEKSATKLENIFKQYL